MPRMTISVRGLDTLAKQLERKQKQAETVIKRTASDMRTRVPGRVANEVVAVYKTNKGKVMPAKIDKKTGQLKQTLGGVKVSGVTIDSVAITYTGELLTPVRFGMKPTQPEVKTPDPKRKHRKRTTPRPETKPITAEIKRGQRKALPRDAFLAKNNGGGYIPFRRKGRKRYPIESIKTTSVPQMVTNEVVYPEVNKRINELLEERLEHHMKQYLEKN